MISFFVPGTPVPQGRARSFKLGDGIGHYDDPKSKAWKKVVAQVAGLQRNRWMDGALKVTMNFCLVQAETNKDKHHIKKPDVDNLSKAVMDALNKICYADDSQVVELTVTKFYSRYAGNIGVQIKIESAE